MGFEFRFGFCRLDLVVLDVSLCGVPLLVFNLVDV